MVCGINRRCGQGEEQLQLMIFYRTGDETKGLSLGEERGERVGRSSGNLSHFLVGVLIYLIVFKYLNHQPTKSFLSDELCKVTSCYLDNYYT